MPTTNDPSISLPGGSNNDNGFFGFIRDIGGIVRDLAPIWDQRGSPPQPNDEPVSLTPGNGTTGTQVVQTQTDITPFIILGGVLIVAVLLIK